jgi:hypothetical protein
MLVAATPGSAQTSPEIAWTQATDVTGFGPDVQLNGVAGLPDGRLVLVAGDISSDAARAWTSEDGAFWEPARLPGPQEWPADVASTEAGAIAVGVRSEGDLGLIWTTTDGTWGRPERVERANFRDVLVSPDGVSIVGDAMKKNGRGIPTLWRSGDRGSWDATPIPAEGDFTVIKHVRLPAGPWLAFGYDFDVETQQSLDRLYRSEDGVTWTAVDGPPDGPEGASALADIEVGPPGFIAVGSVGASTSDDRHGAIWTSADGLAWEPVASSPSGLTAVTAGPSGLYAFSHPRLDEATFTWVDDAAQLLHSTDGSTWKQLDATAFDGAGVQRAAIAPDGRVLATGRLTRGLEFDTKQPSVWVGQPRAVAS